MIYNNLPRNIKKYYSLAYCDNIECAVCNDGQLFMFELTDVLNLLANYPKDNTGWFFNETRDRYIAELYSDKYVTVNPQFCYQNFKEILI